MALSVPPKGGTVIVPVGGRVEYLASSGLIAYDRRNLNTGHPLQEGWFNVYIANVDGTNERSLTSGVNMGWPVIGGIPQWRHVGSPTWAHTQNGNYLIITVEQIDQTSSRSLSINPADHNPFQPGRGTANSLYLYRISDGFFQQLWNFDRPAGNLGSMQAYFSNGDEAICFTRMIAFQGQFATWDMGLLTPILFPPSTTPTPLPPVVYFNPILNAGNVTTESMSEMNSWHPIIGNRIAVSGNPIDGQQQTKDDVFVVTLGGCDLVRKTKSSGLYGEPALYCEHLVYRPDGLQFAYMGTVSGHPQGTELFVADEDDISSARRVSFFNDPTHPQYITPQGGARACTTSRPSWVLVNNTWCLLVSVHNFPNDDGLTSGQGPIMLITAAPQ